MVVGNEQGGREALTAQRIGNCDFKGRASTVIIVPHPTGAHHNRILARISRTRLSKARGGGQ